MSKNQSKLLQDAQDFIKSVEQFGDPNKAAQYQTRQEEVKKIRKSNEQPPKDETSFIPEFLPRTFEKRDGPKPAFWPQLKIVDFRKEAITFIETFYFSNRSLPALADFVLHFKDNPQILPKGPAEWEDFLLNVQEPLTNRGVPPYETPLNYLEPNFVLAVNLIVNAYDKRAVPAKLKEAGLTTKQWNGFLRQESYQQYYRVRLNAIFDEDTQNDVKLALQRLIQSGDLQAIKHYHELQNIYRPQETNNVVIILQAIMEILTLHVAPEVIGKVAESLRNSPQLKAIELPYK